MTINYAPIVLFVYNRYQHTAKTLQSLLANEQAKHSDLFVYSDGPRKPADEQGILQVRSLFANLKGFKSVTVIERDKNFGLAQNIITGVTEICKRFGKVIVIEDDLLLSPYFLQYMNENLERFKEVEQVGSLHGYVIPSTRALPESFFLRGADCWGWATWDRAWAHFEKDGTKLLKQLYDCQLASRFDMEGLSGNIAMLRDQIAGKNNSWAIRWHASLYLTNQLTLFPGKSLVNNIGTDSTGEHCVATDVYAHPDVARHPIQVPSSIELVESKEGVEAYKDFFKQLKPSFMTRVVRKAKRLLLPA